MSSCENCAVGKTLQMFKTVTNSSDMDIFVEMVSGDCKAISKWATVNLSVKAGKLQATIFCKN